MTVNHIPPVHLAPDRNVGGRPTDYSEDLIERFLDFVAETNESLRDICKRNGFPSRVTIMRWCKRYPEFGTDLREIMAGRCDDILMEGLAIADDSTHDQKMVEDEQGALTVQADKDHISRVKLALDYRIMLAKNLAPKAPQGPQGSSNMAAPGVDGAVLLDTRVMEGHRLRGAYEAYERALEERR